jgi:hypothetical protein
MGFEPMIQLTRAFAILAVFETWVILWSVVSKLQLLTSVLRSTLSVTKVM